MLKVFLKFKQISIACTGILFKYYLWIADYFTLFEVKIMTEYKMHNWHRLLIVYY